MLFACSCVTLRCKDTKKNENSIVTGRQNVIFRAELPQSAALTQAPTFRRPDTISRRNGSQMPDGKCESLLGKIHCTCPIKISLTRHSVFIVGERPFIDDGQTFIERRMSVHRR